MDLNSSSDEEEDTRVVPPQQPPAQAAIHPTGGAATESMDVEDDDGIEVEVEAVWEVEVAASSQTEELDPRTLGVPGLKTLMPGHCVEVLWAHGAYHSSL